MTTFRLSAYPAGFAILFALVFFTAGSTLAEEKIYSIDRNLRSGEHVSVDVSDRVIHRVDVLVRRLHKDQTDCYLTVGYKDGQRFGGEKGVQVDRQDLHELLFMGKDERSRDRDLKIQAHNGDVFIREIVVHYR